mmetsp:Transcript_23248/g.39397  ORF Transcript_23248/g.39397 Transcript_23248/m.39397 type:complete len:316 (-) Transcript_23248:1412-2359(-)|eukprot:CAMPEP_0114431208 /NCGR_PEP_ID=MMETSP0103-20121206/10473_1 /TAXON_ID=37642 ORGANISM="Paraphysomonas imperforata, Strain PA2" /NCGR_SAMPLE_ID=MMETSP0103 /ASSEMBLY_ACC=CAM_ASM_000201 /LENGTH=315 /DNA_ID=CAMNT_0001600749 /DNA_START=57 /DNA_END=1004 /DNA_ORIENTATION=+
MTSFSFLLAAFGLPLVYIALHFGFQKEYTVHKSGIVLVSGASTGIGRHAAERLATEGYKVYCGVRKEKDKESILSMKQPNLIPIVFDVTKHETSAEAVAVIASDVEENNLPFIGLVNNAGISRRMVAEFHDMEDIYRVFDTNVFGMMHLTQLCLPLLRQSKGRVVMISSVNGRIGTPMSSTYVSSKFAMEGYSDSLRRELAPHGVSVSVIEPGFVKSAIFATNEAAIAKMMQEDDLSEKTKLAYPHLYTESNDQKRRDNIEHASSPEVTSDAIVHAIRSKFPMTRYPVATVGKMSAAMATSLVSMMPDRVVDTLM